MDAADLRAHPRRIGIIPVPGTALMSYASLVEPLRAANDLAGRQLYEVIHASADGAAVQTSGQAVIEVDCPVADLSGLQMCLVIAGGTGIGYDDPRVLAVLRRLARTPTILGGVSAGPLILVRAGVMLGRRLTLHWEHAPALREMAPDLHLTQSLYEIDRDRVTCAGGTAPADLMHALIAQHHGAVFARRVSDWFLHTDVRPSGGQQRAGLAERLGTTAGPVLDAVAQMETHLADPLTLADLAAVAQVSPRQLNRLFAEKLGQPTMAFYRGLRLEAARGLLRGSSLSATEIALATGFSTAAQFSRAYRLRFGHPPSKGRV